MKTIEVISTTAYGKTYKVGGNTFTESTVPDEIKAITKTMNPVEAYDRFGYTVKVYNY